MTGKKNIRVVLTSSSSTLSSVSSSNLSSASKDEKFDKDISRGTRQPVMAKPSDISDLSIDSGISDMETPIKGSVLRHKKDGGNGRGKLGAGKIQLKLSTKQKPASIRSSPRQSTLIKTKSSPTGKPVYGGDSAGLGRKKSVASQVEESDRDISIDSDEDAISSSEEYDDNVEDESDEVDSIGSSDAKIIVPSRLTARQRALLEASELDAASETTTCSINDSTHSTYGLMHGLAHDPTHNLTHDLTHDLTLSQPTQLTEEEQLRKSEKSRRRKHQRDNKLEESKVATIKRLLQKQSNRSKKLRQDAGNQATANPNVKTDHQQSGPPQPGTTRYLDCKTDTVLLVVPTPAGNTYMERLLDYRPSALSTRTTVPLECATKGCTNFKKYTHPQSGMPVCSLECYKAMSKCADLEKVK